jgi:hypothetical protein
MESTDAPLSARPRSAAYLNHQIVTALDGHIRHARSPSALGLKPLDLECRSPFGERIVSTGRGIAVFGSDKHFGGSNRVPAHYLPNCADLAIYAL